MRSEKSLTEYANEFIEFIKIYGVEVKNYHIFLQIFIQLINGSKDYADLQSHFNSWMESRNYKQTGEVLEAYKAASSAAAAASAAGGGGGASATMSYDEDGSSLAAAAAPGR